MPFVTPSGPRFCTRKEVTSPKQSLQTVCFYLNVKLVIKVIFNLDICVCNIKLPLSGELEMLDAHFPVLHFPAWTFGPSFSNSVFAAL